MKKTIKKFLLFIFPSKYQLKLLFRAQSFIDSRISDACVDYYKGRHPKHFLWTIHYQFVIDNVDTGDRVLDVGTGASLSYTQELAAKAESIDCCDINPELIEKSRRGNKFANVNYIVLDVTQQLPPDSYDVVILSHVLEHLHEPEKVLENLKNITRKLIIRLPRYDDHWMYLVKKDLGMFYYKDHDHKNEYTLRTAVDLVEKSGWRVQTALNDVDVKIVATL
ncbi:MAG: class I SAM-dependent methyltransferase [Patescibacteria group bacterium]